MTGFNWCPVGVHACSQGLDEFLLCPAFEHPQTGTLGTDRTVAAAQVAAMAAFAVQECGHELAILSRGF